MRSNAIAGLASAFALLAGTALSAHAGGLARPNPVSARSVGIGGAFSAIADDPTALHFNPAGIALLPGLDIMVGGEFVKAPRTYTPKSAFCDANPGDAACQPQSPTAPIRPLPTMGFATRLHDEGVPSRLAFGVGFWNTFGGQLFYKDNLPGTVKSTRNAVLEVVPGIGYQVDDVLAIGAAFRLGIGLFDSQVSQRPQDAELSASGVGAGGTLGVMVTPTDALRIGAYYRTSLTVTTNGSGVVHQASGDLDVDIEFKQQWPQQAGLALAFKPMDKLTLAGQFDWDGWSIVNEIKPTFKGNPSLTEQAAIPTDWQDSYQIHLGAQYAASDNLELRGGWTYDSMAVTKRFMEREFLDGNSMFFALGVSVRFLQNWRVDTAFEIGPGGTTTVPDNSADVMGWPARANVSPGDHSGELYTLELALQYLY